VAGGTEKRPGDRLDLGSALLPSALAGQQKFPVLGNARLVQAALQESLDRIGGHQPVRLGKRRQNARRAAAGRAQTSCDPDQQQAPKLHRIARLKPERVEPVIAAIEAVIGTLAFFVTLLFLVNGCGGVDVNVELYTFADTKTL